MLNDTRLLADHLAQVHDLVDSPAFDRNSPDNGPWKTEFAQLISRVHSLLLLADLIDKRVDFRQGVGVNGKVQDITSLVNWMHDRMPAVSSEPAEQLPGNRLNRYFNAGTGRFANGCLFTVEFDSELAFFIDDQRIYLNRQIRRAVSEAEEAIQSHARHNL
ncbi:hypothetical protein [Spirosoma montaniterrae]|uniref:Uncharacterized protein n=1 Tax=Spirosoma montaniterrae TaxID=1178516 RepID=A0A1P9WXI5_9BACT|nr:hypothetical protein [Spirosoma montaniterrae]AQG80070.1 hypothetical protein AWR27_12485 [Spirosoma montaniterrae]